METPPSTPRIAFDKKAVTVGRGGYEARVAEPQPGEAYRWSVANGVIEGEATGERIRFAPAALGAVILSLQASTNSPQPASASLAIAAVAEPPAVALRAPRVVTTGKSGLIAQASSGARYVWRVSRDGQSEVQSETGATLVFAAGAEGSLVVSVQAINDADDTSPEVAQTVQVVGRGLSLLSGSLGGTGSTDGVGADARLDPLGAIIDGQGGYYVLEQSALRPVDGAGKVTTTPFTFAGDVEAVVSRSNGALLLFDDDCRVHTLGRGESTPQLLFDPGGCGSCDVAAPALSSIDAVVSDSAGRAYVAARGGGAVVRFDPAGPALEHFAGSDCAGAADSTAGTRTGIAFASIEALAVFEDELYVLDLDEDGETPDGTNRIYRVWRVPESGQSSAQVIAETTAFAGMSASGNAYDIAELLVLAPDRFLLRSDAGIALWDAGALFLVTDERPGFFYRGVDARTVKDVRALLPAGNDRSAMVLDGAALRHLDLDLATHTGTLSPFAGRLQDMRAPFALSQPAALAYVGEGGPLLQRKNGDIWLADRSDGASIERYTPGTDGLVANTRFVGDRDPQRFGLDGSGTSASLVFPRALAESADQRVYLLDGDLLRRVSDRGSVATLSRGAYCECPGNSSCVLDGASCNPACNGTCSGSGGACRFIGCANDCRGSGGLGEVAFCAPNDLAVLPDGRMLVAEAERARVAVIEDGTVSTFSGSFRGAKDFEPDTETEGARFDELRAIAASSAFAYVLDGQLGRIQLRVIALDSGRVTTAIANAGVYTHNADTPCSEATFLDPTRLAADGEVLYVGDLAAIHRVEHPADPEACRVRTLTLDGVGSGVVLGFPARLNRVGGLFVTEEHDLLVSDANEGGLYLFRF